MTACKVLLSMAETACNRFVSKLMPGRACFKLSGL